MVSATVDSPSQLLVDLLPNLEPKDVLNVLSTYVYPSLDALPAKKKAVLAKALKDANRKLRATLLVMFEQHEKSLEERISGLKDHAENKYGAHETESGMMSGILSEISEWVPKLWLAGVEYPTPESIKLVHKSLQFCESSLYRASNTRSRFDFYQLDHEIELEIRDSDGNTVYYEDYGGIHDLILFVWRDLLLASVVCTDTDTLTKSLLGDLKSSNLLDGIREYLPDDERPEPLAGQKRKRDASNAQADLRSNHWTPEMRISARRVKECIDSC